METVWLNLGASALNLISAALLIYGTLKLRQANKIIGETLERMRPKDSSHPQRQGDQ